MKHEDITHQIIGCAYQVFNKLGFGFLEGVYKNAMVIELNKIKPSGGVGKSFRGLL